MKIDRIIKEIIDRIEYLENKKDKLNLLEMEISKRVQKRHEYELEIDKLYNMLRYSKY